ncbi:MAG: hypothetical protein HC877_14015 [Thioploca sp.]|nr:hypothetical protein [Thioploca sp.]
MKTTTLSVIVISLAIFSNNIIVYAHSGGLVSGTQTNKNPLYNQVPDTPNSNEVITTNHLNTAQTQPCKLPRRSNKNLIKFGINPVDIQSFNPLQLEQLTPEQIKAFDAENLADLLLNTVMGLTANFLSNANKHALMGFQAAQVAKIPAQAFQGFTHNNLGGLTPEAIQAITPKQLNEVEPAEFQALPEKDVSKLLANLNPEQDIIGKVQNCLPTGWEIKPNKGVSRPVGAPITLRPCCHNQSVAGLDMPEIPDLSAGFGLGGSIDEKGKVLTGINETIAATQFIAKQTEEGIVKVQDGKGTELAFLPDADNLIQGVNNTKPTVGTNEAGQYILTLTGGEQITVNPTLKDPQGLLKNLAPQSTIQINQKGHARFHLANEQRTIMCAFNPWVDKAPVGSKPGIKVTGQPGMDEQMVVVYENGQSQEARPAIQSPGTFKNLALNFPGVEKVQLLGDGRINVHYHGQPLVLIPAFDIKPAPTQPCSEEETSTEEEPIEPNVEFNEDGSFTFTNEVGDEQQVFVTEASDNEDINEADNSDNTLPEVDNSSSEVKPNTTETNAVNLPDKMNTPEIDNSSKPNPMAITAVNSLNTSSNSNNNNTLIETSNFSNEDKPNPTATNTAAINSDNSDNKPIETNNSGQVDTSSGGVKPNTPETTTADFPGTTVTNTTAAEENNADDNTLPETNDSHSEIEPNIAETTAANVPNTTVTNTTAAVEKSNADDNTLPETNDSHSEIEPNIAETTTADTPDTTVTDTTAVEGNDSGNNTTTTSNESDNTVPGEDNFNNQIGNLTGITAINSLNKAK